MQSHCRVQCIAAGTAAAREPASLPRLQTDEMPAAPPAPPPAGACALPPGPTLSAPFRLGRAQSATSASLPVWPSLQLCGAVRLTMQHGRATELAGPETPASQRGGCPAWRASTPATRRTARAAGGRRQAPLLFARLAGGQQRWPTHAEPEAGQDRPVAGACRSPHGQQRRPCVAPLVGRGPVRNAPHRNSNPTHPPPPPPPTTKKTTHTLPHTNRRPGPGRHLGSRQRQHAVPHHGHGGYAQRGAVPVHDGADAGARLRVVCSSRAGRGGGCERAGGGLESGERRRESYCLQRQEAWGG